LNDIKKVIKNEKHFYISGDKLICGVCSVTINYDRKHGKQRLKEHKESNKHRKGAVNDNSIQTSIENSFKNAAANDKKSNEFCSFLAKAFVSANIPYEKLNNPTLKNFLFKFTKENIPSPNTLRYNYVEDIYNEKITKIREIIGQNTVYFIIDDTTDAMNRYAFNVLVGKLDGEISKPMLISTQFLENVNFTTINQALNKACQILWPNEIRYDSVLLIVSDQASTMIKAMSHAKILFPNLNHVTCLAHAFHRVCECIRQNNEFADKFILAMKKFLLKSPLRRQHFKEICNIKLPPKPIVTRWGTWLEASFYYVDNFEKICEFVEKFKVCS